MPDNQRIEYRKEVQELLKFVGDKTPEFWEVFADEIKQRDLLQSEEVINPEEFNDEEGNKFGETIVGFGVHASEKYNQVDLAYLEYIADKNIKLVKYVKWRQKRKMI